MADHEHQIRELAYLLWEEAGRPDGRSEEFWLAAVARVAAPLEKPARATKSKEKPTKAAPKSKPKKLKFRPV